MHHVFAVQTPITQARFWKKTFWHQNSIFLFIYPFLRRSKLSYIYIFFQQKFPSQFILSSYASSSFCLNVVFFVPPKEANMHNRQQYRRVGSEMSGMCKSTQGVLQGSILGPGLYNVYINDMLPHQHHFLCKKKISDNFSNT